MDHPDEGHARHLDDKARADEAAYHEGSESAAKADKLKQADEEIERLREERDKYEEYWNEVVSVMRDVEEALGGGGFSDTEYQREYLLGRINRLQRLEAERDRAVELLRQWKQFHVAALSRTSGDTYKELRSCSHDTLSDTDTLLTEIQDDG